ncbi:kinase activator (Mob2) [Cordyceps militaris]|uniref:Kinase activator (Mob2) n=1 Tax=Cordyceps militaris TaxID=73501 RepID=A0A2H4SB81_CORMI|nr:kinase activator (Mob2) [Cordyceps militaris]
MASNDVEGRPLWLHRECAKLITKGNLLTLTVPPKCVDKGEWVAHQVVEQYRLLSAFVRVVSELDSDNTSICNAERCPTMSAGEHCYTWIDEDEQPVRLLAHQYITVIRDWISRKLDDELLFPTDPLGATANLYPHHACQTDLSGNSDENWLGCRSGFPQNFAAACRLICRHMFRIYAHLYWNHFEDFYHLSLEKSLNSCFGSFLMVTVTHDMLQSGDVQPMRDLISLWAANGTFPTDSKLGGLADLDRGKYFSGEATPC